MPKSKFLLFFCLILITGFQKCLAFAKSEIITIYHEDLNGDGVLDTITLYGTPYEDSPYYKQIWAEIEINDKNYRIDLPEGYAPSIIFVDLTHDGINDLFYQVNTGGSGGLYHTKLYTFAPMLKEIPLPTTKVRGHFLLDFRVKIKVPGKAPVILDVSQRKDEYIRLNLYQPSGKLLKKQSLLISPIACYEIIEIDGQKGLKSLQLISGAYRADGLGNAETKWLYQNNKWQMLDTRFIPN